MKLGYGARIEGVGEGWLKRLGRNKRSSEWGGEWRGLIEDGFRWKERKGASLEARGKKGWKVWLCYETLDFHK